MTQRPLTSDPRRAATGLAAHAVAFVVFAVIAVTGFNVSNARAGSLESPGTYILVADSGVAAFGLLGTRTVNDATLAGMRGRGADLNIPFTQTTGVVLWDEVGGRRGGADPVSGGNSGTGNSQSNSLQHR